MFNIQEINEKDKGNYKTLNKDILLTPRSNGTWDFSWNEHDLDSATELYSTEMAIIHACLTSWNFFNRYGNPTYTNYGNRSYSLLKTNKSPMTAYKVKIFFEECINRIRRVAFIEDLTVTDSDEPHTYDVWFSVRCIDDSSVTGELRVSENINKSEAFLGMVYDIPYASNIRPLLVDLQLKNEYASPISDENLYVYLDDVFIGLTENTNQYGLVSYKYTPTETDIGTKTLRFVFKGNSLYNQTESTDLIFECDFEEINTD